MKLEKNVTEKTAKYQQKSVHSKYFLIFSTSENIIPHLGTIFVPKTPESFEDQQRATAQTVMTITHSKGLCTPHYIVNKVSLFMA